MQAVGVRELKAKLSHYLRVAKTGGVVLVTEHGRVIAALGPPAMTELPREPGRRKQPGSYPPTGLQNPDGTGQRLIDEVRGER